MIAIVAAVPEELAAVRRRLEGSRDVAAGTVRVSVGRIAGREVALGIAGDGPLRAQAMIAALLAEHRCSSLIGIGVAGGLTDDLLLGRLVVADTVCDTSGRPCR